MKKFLLSLAALIPAIAMSAQDFTDFFKVTYNGEELSNGQTINVLPLPADDAEYPAEEGKANYLPHIHVINLEEEPRQIDGALLYVDPSASEYNEDDNGFASMCFSGGLYPDLVSPANNCLPGQPGVSAGQGKVIVPAAGTDTFQWEIHLEDSLLDKTTTLSLVMYAQDGYGSDGMDITDEAFRINIVFSTEDSAVEEIGLDDNAPVEYYDLQGRAVSSPAAGIYIVKKGAKVEKRIIL